MFAIQYYSQGGLEVYLAKKRGEYIISNHKEDIIEFDDEFEAIDRAVETAKKVYGKNVEFTLLWHA